MSGKQRKYLGPSLTFLHADKGRTHLEDILKHARELVSNFNARRGRRRIHFPRIKWSKWLFTGGDEDKALPSSARKENRRGQGRKAKKSDDGLAPEVDKLLPEKDSDLEQNNQALRRRRPSTKSGSIISVKHDDHPTQGRMLQLRAKTADILEWIQDSDDVQYAIEFTVAIFLVLWPAFVPSWNNWYNLNRGLWAALQLIFVLEVSIGTSILQFLTRLVGVTLGCLWGWASVEARRGNPIVCAAMVFVGQFPFVYVQIATKYPKGGAVGIVSITVVALASELDTVPGEYSITSFAT